jgi:hypothetical protein
MTQPSAPQDTRLSSSPVLIYTLTGVYPWDTDLVPSPPGSGPEYKVTTEVLREKLLNVVSTGAMEKFTYVATTSGDTVATLQWRDMLSDKVTLRGRPSLGMNSWMKRAGGGVFRRRHAFIRASAHCHLTSGRYQLRYVSGCTGEKVSMEENSCVASVRGKVTSRT